MSKSFYIDTLGCEKNEYDSQMLAASLLEKGCVMADDPYEADIIIVNTCGFIEDAKRESIAHIFEMAEISGGDQAKKLVVTGCLSERYHEELLEEMPEVDIFFGVNEYDKMADTLIADDYSVRDSVGDSLDNLSYRTRVLPTRAHTGWLKIAEGCDNACAFCAIPSIRGRFRSKSMEDCVREAEDLASAGIRELILIAQDTSRYGFDLYGRLALPELLDNLCEIDGIEWIRLMYVYDHGITDELIDTIRRQPKICNYIDIPIQHVSDRVLEMMRRCSTEASIRETINKLRAAIPDIHIRTTLLVGFPGETEEDIEKLVSFVDEMKIDRLGAFAFSDEEGTESYLMDNKLDEETKSIRRDAVMEHQQRVSEELNERKIGRTYEVIIDEIQDDGYAIARTRYDAPEIDCDVVFRPVREHKCGDITEVRITDAYEYDLEGEEV